MFRAHSFYSLTYVFTYIHIYENITIIKILNIFITLKTHFMLFCISSLPTLPSIHSLVPRELLICILSV